MGEKVSIRARAIASSLGRAREKSLVLLERPRAMKNWREVDIQEKVGEEGTKQGLSKGQGTGLCGEVVVGFPKRRREGKSW